jgi:hypothetical protein
MNREKNEKFCLFAPNPRLKTDVEDARLKDRFIRHALAASR